MRQYPINEDNKGEKDKEGQGIKAHDVPSFGINKTKGRYNSVSKQTSRSLSKDNQIK